MGNGVGWKQTRSTRVLTLNFLGVDLKRVSTSAPARSRAGARSGAQVESWTPPQRFDGPALHSGLLWETAEGNLLDLSGRAKTCTLASCPFSALSLARSLHQVSSYWFLRELHQTYAETNASLPPCPTALGLRPVSTCCALPFCWSRRSFDSPLAAHVRLFGSFTKSTLTGTSTESATLSSLGLDTAVRRQLRACGAFEQQEQQHGACFLSPPAFIFSSLSRTYPWTSQRSWPLLVRNLIGESRFSLLVKTSPLVRF